MSHSETEKGGESRKIKSNWVRETPDEIAGLEREITSLQTALSELVHRSVREREAERQAIARELHDNLGQYLSIMSAELQGMRREADGKDALCERIVKLQQLISAALHETAIVAWKIRPLSLDGKDLRHASEQFVADWSERSNLKFDLHLTLGTQKLPPAIEATVYRVLQEAVRNVVKHADATRVGIILQAGARRLRLIVEDDGKGFQWNDKDISSNGFGILGMRERLALVGGTLEIETGPGRGATLFIQVPLWA